jgi:pimeloyl-ACP methyl ester carboxylesterase
MSNRHCFRSLVLLLFLSLAAVSVRAEIVELEVRPGILATASYQPGELEAPPILVLHGFLQTREFSTVKRLADALAESGQTILVPSLSLGLTDRRQSLDCEAIHTHSMADDVAELALWTEWLRRKTGRAPILVGHSAGGRTLASYRQLNPHSGVHSMILISLSYFGFNAAEKGSDQVAERARRDLSANPQQIGDYPLAFCSSYPTTPAAFLSYYDSNKRDTLNVLQGPGPAVSVILGTEDNRVEADWADSLRAEGIRVISIDGANHFFDQTHEFALLDAVEGLLPEAD